MMCVLSCLNGFNISNSNHDCDDTCFVHGRQRQERRPARESALRNDNNDNNNNSNNNNSDNDNNDNNDNSNNGNSYSNNMYD